LLTLAQRLDGMLDAVAVAPRQPGLTEPVAPEHVEPAWRALVQSHGGEPEVFQYERFNVLGDLFVFHVAINLREPPALHA
jgi:hypothetical protein